MHKYVHSLQNKKKQKRKIKGTQVKKQKYLSLFEVGSFRIN